MKDLDDKKFEVLELPECFPNVDVEEQETVISFSRRDDYINIYTSDNTTLTKLKKLMEKGAAQYRVKKIWYIEGEPCGVSVEAAKRCLSLRAGNERELSDEQREALRERMKNINK